MPVPVDPTAPRKKYALAKYARRWNKKHGRQIERPPGFNPEVPRIGKPARDFVRSMQRASGLTVTGQFDRPTMLKLFPPGIRSRVMAEAHAQLGVHEWPAGSNRGEVLKYLEAAGINFGAPWCAAFVTWVLKREGFERFPTKPAWVPAWVAFAKEHDLLKPAAQSRRGDLWCWDWDGGLADHIGFCDDTNPRDLTAYYLDGNVGAYGGSVTHGFRPVAPLKNVIDLVKLYQLGHR